MIVNRAIAMLVLMGVLVALFIFGIGMTITRRVAVERFFFLVPGSGAADKENLAYYPDCRAARAAGVTPIQMGAPGYRPELDSDGDGIACEPFRDR